MQEDTFLATYIAECSEHLETVENDLLEMERLGVDAPQEIVNRVFRAAHSIKGGAGFFELTSIKDLGHKLENVLEMIRSRKLVPNPEVVNQLLLGFDKMKALFADIATAATADVSEEILALTGLASSYLPSGKKEQAVVMSRYAVPDSRIELEASELMVDSYRSEGHGIALVIFDLIHDVQRLGKQPQDVLRQLDKQGVLLDCAIDIYGVGDLSQETIVDKVPFYVLLSTEKTVRELSDALDIDASSIQFVELPSFDAPATKRVATPASIKEPEVEAFVEKSTDKALEKGSLSEDAEGSIRIAVTILDQLMNHASELVLARNELLESIRLDDLSQIAKAGRRIDGVTREMQEAVMLTRMQPIGNLFSRFPRIVRDLARDTGKKIELNITGREVEVDKTILERLSDPLTHLIRNASDHGLERPDERQAAGKPPTGTITLAARHEAGKIVVEIQDNGKGIDTEAVARKAHSLGLVTDERLKLMSEKEKAALILLPGLSTAKTVTDLSGRGVGMDVVKTNIDQLGGQLEISTRRGIGTTFTVQLPLTLAIIPSLLVSVGAERFAIPEANVGELLRLRPGDVKNRIERLGNRTILNLRGGLIPVVSLAEVLGVASTDRRTQWAGGTWAGGTIGEDRRFHADSDVRVVVVNSTSLRYALVVDEFHDTMEIVVRPLGNHFAQLKEYSGATILGNGTTSLILDTTGVASRAGLFSVATEEIGSSSEETTNEFAEEGSAGFNGFLLFGNGPDERCAVVLDIVDRVVPLERSSITTVGAVRVFNYQNAAVPLVTLSDVLDLKPVLGDVAAGEELLCILIHNNGKRVGLAATGPIDSLFEQIAVDSATFHGRGLRGNAMIKGQLTLVVDWNAFLHTLSPSWLAADVVERSAPSGTSLSGPLPVGGKKILLVDDSDFFRSKIAGLLRETGYDVSVASDGQEAFNLFSKEPSFAVVVSDIEMPVMDGFELVRHVRAVPSNVPFVALTSLASEEDELKAKALGVDSFLVKLDEEQLLETVKYWLKGGEK